MAHTDLVVRIHQHDDCWHLLLRLQTDLHASFAAQRDLFHAAQEQLLFEFMCCIRLELFQ